VSILYRLRGRVVKSDRPHELETLSLRPVCASRFPRGAFLLAVPWLLPRHQKAATGLTDADRVESVTRCGGPLPSPRAAREVSAPLRNGDRRTATKIPRGLHLEAPRRVLPDLQLRSGWPGEDVTTRRADIPVSTWRPESPRLTP
jgi:hypothetical protein